MRPGREGPGVVVFLVATHSPGARFNEARARTPGNGFGGVHRQPDGGAASMRPEHERPGMGASAIATLRLSSALQ